MENVQPINALPSHVKNKNICARYTIYITKRKKKKIRKTNTTTPDLFERPQHIPQLFLQKWRGMSKKKGGNIIW